MPVDPIKQRAADLGFALCGVCEARPSDHTEDLHAWLEEGRHGEMSWLARNVEVRTDPSELLPGAKSIIVVADYIGPTPTATSAPQDHAPSETQARIARYAQLTDYHKVITKRLHTLADELRVQHPDHAFRVCVDTAPILEREHAQRAGIGWTGKHTLTINRRLGSHMLLGLVVTTLELPADQPETDHCGTCTRCIDACPTDCITSYSIDASRCISYLTIEHRGPIDPEFHEPIGDWLYGCDVCQDVCPHTPSRDQPHDAASPSHYEARPATMNPLDVLDWTEADRRAAFHRSPMKRAKLDQMRRNAAIVAVNLAREQRLAESEHASLFDRLRQIEAYESESATVRETATRLLLTIEGRPAR